MSEPAPKLDMPAFDSGTLMGDLRDAVLDRLRAMPKPWTVMSENEQGDLIAGVERVAEHLVRTAVEIIAANGHPVIRATLESCTLKDGIKAVITLSRHDAYRHQLTDAVGKAVLLVVADHQQFMGERAPAKPDPEEPPLPLDGGDNVKPLKPRD